MDNNKRIVEILSDLLIETQQIRIDGKALKNEVHELKKQQVITNERLNKVNVGLAEVRLSVMKLTGKVEQIGDLDKRLRKVEKIVLK